MKEIAFDPNSLMQGVKDKIKETFTNLITEEEWNGLIKKEIDAFFTDTVTVTYQSKEEYNYGSNKFTNQVTTEKVSPFRALVWDFCRDKVTTFLKETITKEVFKDQYGPQIEYNDKLKDLITESIPSGVQKFFEAIAYYQVDDVRQKINNMQFR